MRLACAIILLASVGWAAAGDWGSSSANGLPDVDGTIWQGHARFVKLDLSGSDRRKRRRGGADITLAFVQTNSAVIVVIDSPKLTGAPGDVTATGDLGNGQFAVASADSDPVRIALTGEVSRSGLSIRGRGVMTRNGDDKAAEFRYRAERQ